MLSTDLAASQDNHLPPDGDMESAFEGNNHCEVDVDRNMEQELVVEEDLPHSEEQWLRANSDNESDKWTIWYTDQVRKWYKHAVSSLKSH